MIRLWLWVFERKTTEIKCHSHQIMWRLHIDIISMMYDSWRWPWSPGWGCVCQVSPLSSYFSPIFSYCILWKEVTICSPQLSGELYSTLSQRNIYINYLEFICRGDVSIVSYLFIYSIIYLYHHGFMDIYALSYNPTLLYFVAQIVPTLAIQSSFSWLLCPLKYSSHCGVLLSTSLLSGTTRCSRLILYISCPSSRVRDFSMEP